MGDKNQPTVAWERGQQARFYENDYHIAPDMMDVLDLDYPAACSIWVDVRMPREFIYVPAEFPAAQNFEMKYMRKLF